MVQISHEKNTGNTNANKNASMIVTPLKINETTI